MRLENFLAITLCTSTIVFLAPIFARAIAYSAFPMISAIGLTAVSYTHLTLPTKLEV